MSGAAGDWVARLRDAADAPDLGGTRYELRDRLGRGGMGTVYRAFDAELGRDVALKVLSLPDPSGALARRMVREAQVVASLEHPGIVPIHDVGRLPDGRVFYVMKLVRGRRLDAWAREAGDARAVVRLLQRVAEAVAFAHAHGVVHRDLKPSNVMVGAFGEALVMDWGVARVRRPEAPSGAPAGGASAPAGAAASAAGVVSGAADAGTGAGAVIGTPGFMAPEQAAGDGAAVGPASDVHGLGATLAAVLPAPLPRRLAAVRARACAAEPAARYASATAFAADLGAWLEGQPMLAYRENLFERAARLVRRHAVLVSLVVAYLVMRLLVLVVLRI